MKKYSEIFQSHNFFMWVTLTEAKHQQIHYKEVSKYLNHLKIFLNVSVTLLLHVDRKGRAADSLPKSLKILKLSIHCKTIFVIEAIATLEKFTSLASFSVEGGAR